MAEFVISIVDDESKKDVSQNEEDIGQFASSSEEIQCLSEVVVLSDIAEETVVTTTKNLASQNEDSVEVKASTSADDTQNNRSEISNTESDVITEDMLENGYQISVTSGVVWNEVIKGFQEEGSEIDMIKIQPETFIAINPGSTNEEGLSQNVYELENSEVSMREITKRERDRQKKREQRADPNYRAKEKAKNRERMKAKRKNDPTYRAEEKVKDRERRRTVRQTNEELRNRERERDREYKRYLRETDREYKVGLLRDDDSNLMTEPMMDISLI